MTPQAERGRNTITVPDVYHYTGINSHPESFTFTRLTGIRERGARFVVLFEWDAGAPYLDLDVSWGTPGGPTSKAHSNTREAAQLLLACGVPRDNLPKYLKPEGEVKASRRFLIADLSSDSSLQLTVRIDTDH